jgi:two-component system, cell cycle sensor histidine kinase and response regulator CckA
MNMLERLLDQKVKLEFEPDSALQQVNADACQIEQVVMNLVVNARDAMPAGGTISVRTRNVVFPGRSSGSEPTCAHPGQYVCISVSDSGSGMDEEVLAHLFEPFFTTKPSGQGTGLGLAVIYGIIEQHHGWIDVESEKGKGSEFKVFFPICENS